MMILPVTIIMPDSEFKADRVKLLGHFEAHTALLRPLIGSVISAGFPSSDCRDIGRAFCAVAGCCRFFILSRRS